MALWVKNWAVAMLSAALIGCSGSTDETGSRQGTDKDGKPQYVLAFSWQPAFCETRPRKPECRSQTADRFDARNFTLHGLWPQPGSNIYCGVPHGQIEVDKAGRWRDLDTPRIAQPIWDELRVVMPGTRSALHEHEWIKHGTCYEGKSVDDYYADSLKLMRWLNRSSLRIRFDSAIGDTLTGKDIRDAFERDFGRGVGDRLRISCRKDTDSDRQLIVEMTLGLAGDIAAATRLEDLILEAPQTDPGCPAGIVDAVGLQ